jgi:hypothetical protein
MAADFKVQSLCCKHHFRPAGAGGFSLLTYGLRRGLRSYAASRLLRANPTSAGTTVTSSYEGSGDSI